MLMEGDRVAILGMGETDDISEMLLMCFVFIADMNTQANPPPKTCQDVHTYLCILYL